MFSCTQLLEPYLKSHVVKFSGKSITSNDFKAHLYDWFDKNHGSSHLKRLDAVDWNAWFFGQGMPPVENKYNDVLAKECEALCKRYEFLRAFVKKIRWIKTQETMKFEEFNKKDLSVLSTTQKSNTYSLSSN